MQCISEKLRHSCKRLAIGCTYGNSEKRLQFLKAMSEMRSVNDLDLPPFVFHLAEIPAVDAVVEKLFRTLPLKSLGLR